jgi:AcrR family transcriptional regulator
VTTDRDTAARESRDGRHLRRDRNRTAVVEALLELYAEGNLDPGSVEIADRAGLSPRSLFRYFDDVDDLCHEAVKARQRTLMPLLHIDAAISDPLPTRVDAFLRQRAAIFATMGNVGRVARLRAPFLPVIATELAVARQYLRGQVSRFFAAELTEMGEPAAAATLMAVDALCSFDSNELFIGDQCLEPHQVHRNLRAVLLALLGGEPIREVAIAEAPDAAAATAGS